MPLSRHAPPIVLLLAVPLAGCLCGGGQEIRSAEIVIESRLVPAPGADDWFAGGAHAGTSSADPQPRERIVLGSWVAADRAALGLLGATLGRVALIGGARSAVEGLDHFSRSAPPRVTVRMLRPGGGAETWLIDREWAMRKLEGGAMLFWQGDLRGVMETLALVR